MVVINAYDKRTTFYKMVAAEHAIRDGANKNKNAYYIGIFACCREIFNPKTHRDYFAGTEVQAHIHFVTRLCNDALKALAESKKVNDEAERVKALEKRIKVLELEALLQKNIE